MKNNTLTIIGAAIIVILLGTTIMFSVQNSRNKQDLSQEKIQNEGLTTQKTQVSQELDKTKSDLATVTSNKEAVEKNLADVESKIIAKDKQISSLAGKNKTLMKDRDDLAVLKKEKSDLDKTYQNLKLEEETATTRIKELENSKIVLDSEKNDLAGRLDKSEKYRTDNIEIFGSRGNTKDKLAVYACRTKKLNLNFEVPQSLTETISFKIITPAGTTITPEDKSLSWYISNDSRNYTASLSAATGEFEPSRKVVLSYASKEKMVKGEYKIQIFSNDMIIGNCRVKLK